MRRMAGFIRASFHVRQEPLEIFLPFPLAMLRGLCAGNEAASIPACIGQRLNRSRRIGNTIPKRPKLVPFEIFGIFIHSETV